MLRDLRARWQRQVVGSPLADGCVRTLCALALFLDRHGRGFPSYATLAAMTGQERRSVIRQIRQAERSGHLQVEHSHPTNVYQAILLHETVMTVESPAMMTEKSPVMVTEEREDGDRRLPMVVTRQSPEICKRNLLRSGETRPALQGAARSPNPEVPARIGEVMARITKRIETRAAGAKP